MQKPALREPNKIFFAEDLDTFALLRRYDLLFSTLTKDSGTEGEREHRSDGEFENQLNLNIRRKRKPKKVYGLRPRLVSSSTATSICVPEESLFLRRRIWDINLKQEVRENRSIHLGWKI